MHKIICSFDQFGRLNFQNFLVVRFFHYFPYVLTLVYAAATNGTMYTKAQRYRKAQSVVSCLCRQFIHYLHPRWGKPKYRSITEQFYKNNPTRRKHDENGSTKDNVLNMINNQYLDHMYKAWLKNRKSVSSSWDSYFKLIHAKSPKDSRAKTSSLRVSSSPKLMTSNLDGGQSGKSKF